MENTNWEDEFFNRLSDKLEEIFPKTNKDNPEIPSEGNRSGAVSFNAFANIIFSDILNRAIASERQRVREKIDNLIAEEILICHHENQATSRLTSLAMKTSKLLEE